MKKRIKLLASCSALAVVLAIAGVAVMSATNISVSIENTINYVATGNVKATVQITEYGAGANTTINNPESALPAVSTLKVEIEGDENSSNAGNLNIGDVELSATNSTQPIVYYYTVQVTNNAPSTDTNKNLKVEFTPPTEHTYSQSQFGLRVVYGGTALSAEKETILRPDESVTMTVTFTGNPNTTYDKEAINSTIALSVTSEEPAVVGYNLKYVSSYNATTIAFDGDLYDEESVDIAESTFEISDLQGLFNFAAIVNGERSDVSNNSSTFTPTGAITLEGATVVLKNNIYVSDFIPRYKGNGDLLNPPTQTNWAPIGTSDTIIFKGTFDGDGHEISGIYINGSTLNYQGVFGYVDNGSIQNLGLVNSYINGNNNIGGIAGYVDNGTTITNCYNTGNISGKSEVGGIAGYVLNGSIITNCYNACNITAENYAAGGIAGRVWDGTITYCYNSGNITVTALYGDTGGIVGFAEDITITDCYNIGNISAGTYYAGGVAGEVYNGTITNCYSTGDIRAVNNYAGGITGFIYGEIIIADCYNTGNISAGNKWIGGIAGNVSGGIITNCYNNGVVSGKNNVGGIAGSASGGIITNCYNTGNISGNNNVGGIAGSASSGTITGCYYLSGTTFLLHNGGGTTYTVTALLTQLKSYVTTNPTQGTVALSTWKTVAGLNNGYPVFVWQELDDSQG